MKDFFVVLGGMGTMATESFVHQLNKQTVAKKDQDYLNYLVVNYADIPDRTAYILNQSDESPVPYLKENLKELTPLNPDFFVITCNTAHYFYDELQNVTTIPIKHMPKLTLEEVAKNAAGEKQRVMILATSGTIKSGVYSKEFSEYPNLEAIIPDEKLQAEVMKLIYQDIKESNYLNFDRFEKIVKTSIEDSKCDQVILGCTELSLMQDKYPIVNYPVVDAQQVLVQNVLKEYQNKK